MLINHTLDKLRALKLTGMADAFTQQLEQPSTHELAFNERFALLVDREVTHRENRRLTRLLQLAHLRQQACIEDIDYKHWRGLRSCPDVTACNVRLDTRPSQLTYHHSDRVRQVVDRGALSNQACRQGLSVRYERASHLLEHLRIARGDGSYGKRLLQLAKTDLLILDDFGLKPLAPHERHDLLEVIEDRQGNRSTLITSHKSASGH